MARGIFGITRVVAFTKLMHSQKNEAIQKILAWYVPYTLHNILILYKWSHYVFMVITAAYTCLCSFILQTLVCFGSATCFSCRCPLFREFVFILRACILFTIDSGVFLCFAWFLFLSLYRYMHSFSGGSMEMLTFSLPLNMGILHQDSICMILFCFLVMMVCKL